MTFAHCCFPKGQLGYDDTDYRGNDPGEMGGNLHDVDLGNDFVLDTVSLGGYHSCALSLNHTIKVCDCSLYSF